jgi:predicted Zn-dependent protease with MMP-like domain
MSPGDSPDRVLDRAEAALVDGRPDAALLLCEQVLADEPLHGGALFVQGDCLRALGDGRAAAEAFRLAAQVQPQHAPSWASHALVALELLWFETATASIERALQADPACAEAWWVRSLLAEWCGDPAEVERARARAARLDPEGFPLPPVLTEREVEALVEEALAALHPSIQRRLANVAILLEELPSLETLASLEPQGSPFGLLGLFDGPSLRERNHEDPWSLLPPTVTLYRRNLERRCHDHAELVEELRITLYHEIGHFLGLEEEDLVARGLD